MTARRTPSTRKPPLAPALFLALLAALPAAAQTDIPARDAPHPVLALSPPFARESGHAFVAVLPDTWPPDTVDRQASPLLVLEDGVALGPAHALHVQIREGGAGAYSHWGGELIFSSSDNSDPNTNGRHYVVEYRGPVGLGLAGYDPLALHDPFALLGRPTAVRADATGPAASPAAPASEARAPRIIWWYTIDALRADTVFAAINGEPVMPALADFARHDAVRFENAYATSSFTKSSTATMFTGLWPTRHRVMHGVLPVWPDGVELVFDLDSRFSTLAEELAAQGYDTWTHLYSLHVRRGDGMLAGFRHVALDVAADPPLTVPPPGERLFVYEHVLGVHAPYASGAEARARLGLPAPALLDPAGTAWFDRTLDAGEVRELHDAYLAEGADADARFAQRVAWLKGSGLWDDTLLIVTADHGEAFLEHGLTQHSTSLYEEMVRVPLCLHFPAGSPYATLHGRSLPHRVSLADLYPTLLELSSAPPPDYALDGRSLLPILDGRETDPRGRDVLLRCSFTRRVEDTEASALFVTDAILSGSLKAQFGYRVQSSQEAGPDAAHHFRQGDWIAELFDLATDPQEQVNLADQRPEEFLQLMRAHAAGAHPLLPRGESAPAPAPPHDDTPAATLPEALRQFGYTR